MQSSRRAICPSVISKLKKATLRGCGEPGRQHQVADHVQGETGLADRRAGRQHEHLAGLESAGILIQLGVTGRDADLGLAVEQVVQCVKLLLDGVLDFDDAVGVLFAADLEDVGFDLFDQLGGVGIRIVAFEQRFRTDVDHPPQRRVLAQDLAPCVEVHRGGDAGVQFAEEHLAADHVELFHRLEPVGDRNQVDLQLGIVVQFDDRFKNRAVNM